MPWRDLLVLGEEVATIAFAPFLRAESGVVLS